MDSYRKISMIIGVFYIIDIVSGMLSVVFIGTIGEAANYDASVGMHETFQMLVVLMVLMIWLIVKRV